jgi:hypothetical protein
MFGLQRQQRPITCPDLWSQLNDIGEAEILTLRQGTTAVWDDDFWTI